MQVIRCSTGSLGEWLALRHKFWPNASGRHTREVQLVLLHPAEGAAFLARDADDEAVGFAEVALRRDYVNGCSTSPVAFLEGIYVLPHSRHKGAARLLVAAVEGWAREAGCKELASDSVSGNDEAIRMHEGIGFTETERVVFFKKDLT